jgi:hypothetical protein
MKRWLLPLAAVLGCGSQPQIGSENLELLQSLVTATSAKNAAWIAAHEQQVEALAAEGKATSAEKTAFAPIYAAAKAGDWAMADRLTRELSKGQKLDRFPNAKPKKPERREPPTSLPVKR